MNLFYNSSMPSCVVICRNAKLKARKGKILIVNAVNEVSRERAQSFLSDDHIARIVRTYHQFKDEPGFARVVSLDEVRKNAGNLNLPLYVTPNSSVPATLANNFQSLPAAIDAWLESCSPLSDALSLSCVIGMPSGSRPGAKLRGVFAKNLLGSRKNWRRVRLGDVLEKTEYVERNPLQAGFNRYLLVEHLDAGSLRIRRWGDIASGNLPPTFYKVFRKGQILYPTRNPHLRRAAAADFDGICGEKTLTVSVREGVDPRFMPFVFHSEAFVTFATNRKIGSTNPHIRWRDVSDFKLDLPPLDHQRRIAEILWAVDEVAVKSFQTLADAEAVVSAELNDFLYRKSKWPIAPTRDLLLESTRNGFSPQTTQNAGHIPTLSISAIRGGFVVPEGSVKYADVNPSEVESFLLRRDDVLVVRGNGNRLLCGRAGIVKEFPEGCFYPDLLIRLRFRPDKILPGFGTMQWNEAKTHARLLKKAKSTNGISKINNQDVQSHELFVPPIPAQTKFLDNLRNRTKLISALKSSAENALSLQQAFINTVIP
jgi:type I restriction enzyme, S subunit